MRTLRSSFTMRKDGALPRGDWFVINRAKTKDDPADIYIYDEIGFWGTEASEFVKQLSDITESKINLHLNSPGGEVFDGLAIFNALKQHSSEVTVYVDGLAASAASFIAQAGDKVVMARNAQMMIHDGIAMAYGNEADLLETAALLGKISDNIADIYAFKASGRGFDTTLEEFRALMREEVWYSGKEAVDAGLADEVLDHDDSQAEEAKNKWDLSFYNYAGRERAESPARIAARLLMSNQTKENKMADAPENNETPDMSSNEDDNSEDQASSTAQSADSSDSLQPVATNSPVSGSIASGSITGVMLSTDNSVVTSSPVGVMINGKLETDWKVINDHIAVQTAALNEQRNSNRRKFVEALAQNKKIPASMIDGLVEFVNGTNERPGLSDEQYSAFVASYESAPTLELFGTFDAGNGYSQPDAAASREQRIAILQGIVDQQRRAAMPEDELKKTNSYIELQSLLGSNEF